MRKPAPAGNTVVLALLAPLLAFGLAGMLKDAPGEWGAGAVSAWGALILAFVAGTLIASEAAAWIGILAVSVLGIGLLFGGPVALALDTAVACALLAAHSRAGAPALHPALLPAVAIANAGVFLRVITN